MNAKPRKPPRLYAIDGEELTQSEIVQKTGLAAGTIRRRIERGIRSWAGLTEDPAKVLQRNRDRMRKLMASERAARDQAKALGPLPVNRHNRQQRQSDR